MLDIPLRQKENSDEIVVDPELVAEELALEEACSGSGCTPMPPTMLLKLRVKS